MCICSVKLVATCFYEQILYMYIWLSYYFHNVNLSKASLLLESGFYSNTLTLNVENNWNLSSQPVNQISIVQKPLISIFL